MNRLVIAPAAGALFRALVARAGLAPDRTLLTGVETVEWQSLTLNGERHRIGLRLTGPGAEAAATAMCDGLEDAELPMSRGFVADIALERPLRRSTDGAYEIHIEALTISD
jgi:hypothetical protein